MSATVALILAAVWLFAIPLTLIAAVIVGEWWSRRARAQRACEQEFDLELEL